MTILKTSAGAIFLHVMLAIAVIFTALSFLPAVSHAQLSNLLNSSTGDESSTSIYIEGYIEGGLADGHGDIAPVPGATIYFIRNQTIVNQSTTDAVGYYCVLITPGEYSVVTVAQGFQTLMTADSFQSTQTFNVQLETIPYSGIIPYAVNPVVETSPGEPVAVTIAVTNSQLSDQYLTFTEQVPNSDWSAWPADGDTDGDMLGVVAGDTRQITFDFEYNGNDLSPAVMYIIVSGGSYMAKIPVVIVVKNMPYESVDLYSDQPERVTKANEKLHFTFDVDNTFDQAKPLLVEVQAPGGWGATTGNGTYFYAMNSQPSTSDFWVYVPENATPGDYYVNLTLIGQNVKSNTLNYMIEVQGTPVYDAIISGYTVSEDGDPNINVTAGENFDIPVRVYDNGQFPLDIAATAIVGDNWAYYLNGAPWNTVHIDPGTGTDFAVCSKVPNGTIGNYTAEVWLDGTDQDGNDEMLMLMAHLDIQPTSSPPVINTNALSGLLLAAGTAGVIMLSLVTTTRKRRR
jgi:uncharacterized membrane protein